MPRSPRATRAARRKPAGSGRKPSGPDGEPRNLQLHIRHSQSELLDLQKRAEAASMEGQSGARSLVDYARGLLWPHAVEAQEKRDRAAILQLIEAWARFVSREADHSTAQILLALRQAIENDDHHRPIGEIEAGFKRTIRPASPHPPIREEPRMAVPMTGTLARRPKSNRPEKPTTQGRGEAPIAGADEGRLEARTYRLVLRTPSGAGRTWARRDTQKSILIQAKELALEQCAVGESLEIWEQTGRRTVRFVAVYSRTEKGIARQRRRPLRVPEDFVLDAARPRRKRSSR